MINFMAVVHGSRHDYNRWTEMGNEGWSYEDVLPYFKKIETVMDKKLTESGTYLYFIIILLSLYINITTTVSCTKINVLSV